MGRVGTESAKRMSANMDVVVKLNANAPKIPNIILITSPYLNVIPLIAYCH